ncbi:TPA: helix-turn-helix domain-containing protein [Enterococcus faecalis]|uniref:helix-turn-helix transcriptional regulator n=1 Tax=Enterococcus faecalis TaxID=1351 RepID=UPI00094F3016|nr:helix-turn-helix domain-containing protein [Enterococcus faecalis]EGO2596522.1 helix-turn-helix domain-containing protein [Enterococcus faecalis]EGO2603249.1 helix-turn-helix domain-containing protein [Enterococcus faecalis]EGO2619208.1 helix-turn-helix domain-containing protein [Enterococcus faecalis]EGO2725447.1 helix-turn-helix domain-containing protein [Enterococcus faecalis]EGO2811395.1 helix-turn-helix domain-containing protein [Enterococcus faecalis]
MKTLLNKQAMERLMESKNDDAYSLAKRMNVAPSTIYRILNGDRGVGSDLIAKLLRAFDLSEKDFDKLFIFSEVLPNVNGGSESCQKNKK